MLAAARRHGADDAQDVSLANRLAGELEVRDSAG
jgi:hypothetical protein